MSIFERAPLEQRLEQIKRIKYFHGGHSYVGTQEALNYLRGLEQIETRPQEIADAVNPQLGNVQYRATPERVVAAYVMLLEAGATAGAILLTFYENEAPFYKFNQLERKVERDINPYFVSALYRLFEKANSKQVNDDQSFFHFMIRKYLPRKIQRRAKLKWPPRVKIGVFDFKERYEKEKINAVDGISRDALSQAAIVRRMEQDRIEFQSEHQREIIDRYLRSTGFDTISKSEPQPKTAADMYAILLQTVEKQLDDRKKLLWRIKYELPIVIMPIDVPESMVQDGEDEVEESRMLRHFLGRQKSYVMKRLEHYLKS